MREDKLPAILLAFAQHIPVGHTMNKVLFEVRDGGMLCEDPRRDKLEMHITLCKGEFDIKGSLTEEYTYDVVSAGFTSGSMSLLLLLLLLPPPLLLLLAVGGMPAAVGEVADVCVAGASSLSVNSVICCFNREASIKSSTCTADAFAMLSSTILAAMVVRVFDAAVVSSSREAAATLAPAAFCKHVAALSPVSPPPVTYDAVILAWHSANSRAWPFVASAAISTIPTSAKTPAANQAMHFTLRRHTRAPAAVVEDATAMGARSSARTSRSRSLGLVTVMTAMAATVLLRPTCEFENT